MTFKVINSNQKMIGNTECDYKVKTEHANSITNKAVKENTDFIISQYKNIDLKKSYELSKQEHEDYPYFIFEIGVRKYFFGKIMELYEFMFNYGKTSFMNCEKFKTKDDFMDLLNIVSYPLIKVRKSIPFMDLTELSYNLNYWSLLPANTELFDYLMNEIIKKDLEFTIIDFCAGRSIWSSIMNNYFKVVYEMYLRFDCIDIVNNRSFMPIIKGDQSIIHNQMKSVKYSKSMLMIHWPPQSNNCAYDALKNFTGKWLLYGGCDRFGCTANSNFFDLLESEWTLVKIFDQLSINMRSNIYIYKRKKKPNVLHFNYGNVKVIIMKHVSGVSVYIKPDEKKLPPLLKDAYILVNDRMGNKIKYYEHDYNKYRRDIFCERLGKAQCCYNNEYYIQGTDIKLSGMWIKKVYHINLSSDKIHKDVKQILEIMYKIKLNKNSKREWFDRHSYLKNLIVVTN